VRCKIRLALQLSGPKDHSVHPKGETRLITVKWLEHSHVTVVSRKPPCYAMYTIPYHAGTRHINRHIYKGFLFGLPKSRLISLPEV
jgi:hypothetical protein